VERLKLLLMFFLPVCLVPAAAWAQEAASQGGISGAGIGYLSAAIAVGASTLGAGIAVAVVGSAAMGALSEKPELAGRALIFVGLAEGIAIYGMIVALMILAKL
jgi:V/A-type H+-transporting ATPase subunit K